MTQPDTINKQKIFRPPLHSHNIYIDSKTVQTYTSATTLPEIPLENPSKTEPKARLTLVRPRQLTLEFIKRNSEGTKNPHLQEQNSLLKKDEHFLLSSRSYHQSLVPGRMFGSKLIDQEKTQDFDITSKRLSSYRSIKDDDPDYAQTLLQKLFTNEKILSSGLPQVVENVEPTAPDKDEPQRFNNPLRKVNNGKIPRWASQGKPPSKPSLSQRGFRLFEETFTKITLDQSLGKTKEETKTLDISREDNSGKAQTYREGHVVEKLVASTRGRVKSIQYNKAENIEEKKAYSSTKVISRGRHLRETKNILTSSGNITERKFSAENEETVLYLRSKSTGNMVRVNQGNIASGNPPKLATKEASLTEICEKQNTENPKILLSCLI